MDKKRIIKYFSQFIVIVLIGAGIFFGIGYYRYRTSPEYRQYQDLLAQKERYMADTYGGDTPEETLELFISALKSGDVDLASKYFVLDKQEEWRKNLAKLKDKDLLNKMALDLERKKDKKPLIDGDNNRFNFFIYNDDNVLAVVIDIGKGPNNKWKLLDL